MLYAPAYFFKTRKAGRGGLNFLDRLGLRLSRRTSVGPCLWFHAVSVGEVLSLRRLFREIKKEHHDWEIYCSTLTSTGHEVARAKLTEAASVFFVPLDFAWTVKRFFRALHPDLFVLVESEFWPNLLRISGKSASAVLLINGRISDRSFRKYRLFKPLMRRALQPIDRYLVQTEQDRERLLALGVQPDKTDVAGNLKTDVNLPELKPEDLARIKREIGLSPDKKVIVAGSTHKGEEAVLLSAYCASRKQKENVCLIIAPRHPQRADEVEKLAAGCGLRVSRKSEASPGRSWDVLILDTLGELAVFYALSDVAFVGGSLVPKGGQNLLEPAFYGKPVIFGPSMHNFAFLAEEFVRRGAARQVSGLEDLTEVLLFEEEIELQKMGRQSRELLSALQGATLKTLQVIESLMAASSSVS
ncbi:MAG: 3-deoxy-D-manno-octulosonic acid transferase [Clostridiales bacterium]|nr:3-deoxy-D-manno-octulosonic acid transferase [Clostridiales bacterium]